MTYTLTDASDVPNTVTAQRTIVIGAPGVLAIAGAPPAGVVGVAYSTNLSASGGVAPYTWTISAGTLPSGLTLNASTGAITGTPSTTGVYLFTTQAVDTNGLHGIGVFTVTITSATLPLSLTAGTLPSGTVGTPYSATIGVTGGNSPYSCAITSGSLPAGLTLGAACLVSGTPTTAGTTSVTVKATDSSNPALTVTGTETVTINPAAATLVISSPPAATVGTPYTGTVGVSGGTGPYTCSLVSGTLPAGLTLGTNCVITGTPTTSGSSTVTVKGTDSSSPANNGTGPITITVNPQGSLTITSPPPATTGVPYTGTIVVSGGTGPYSCSITVGSLPAGLTLGANCTITGTPTGPGSTTVTVTGIDSGNPPKSGTGPITVTVNPAALSLTSGTLPNGTVGTPYSAVIGVTGGTSPYSCAITSGTLPAGLTLGGGCLVSGTPTTAGTITVTVKATDSGNPTQSTTGPETITISPAALSLTAGTLPNGTVGTPYSATIGVSGGTTPYTCAITSGTLPAGLTLGTSCLVSGTPTTVGTTTVIVKATDSGNPAQSTTGPETITINPASLSLTSGTLPNGTVGTPYSSVIGVSGGTTPYSCAITSGTLPAGLALAANCLVSGTPTTAGTTTVTVKATDSGNPAQSTTGPETITISPAALTLTTGTLPNGTVGTPYSATIGVSGGTSPYSCTITSGTLPGGLSLGANCLVSGTPTTMGTTTVTVKATDSGNPTQSTTGPETITINPAGLSLTAGTLPNGTVNTPYSATIGVSGGTSPYSCTITSGTLPAGLALGANCLVSGTPTTAGTTTITVKATDSGNPTQSTTGPETITINPAALSLTTGTLPNGTVGAPYSSTIGVAGGTSPYTCAITSGTLPAGLTLATNCLVSGTPTTAGTLTVTVKATDSGNPAQSTTGPETITINPAALSLTTGTLPSGTVGTPYSSIIGVSGGTSPYTCTITSGTLPAGLALAANCLVSGTPTTAGTTTVMVKATDSGNPAQSTTGPETITINPAALTLTTGTLPNGMVGTPYSATIGVSGGTSPYSCTITAGTLPTGLSLGAACLVSGTPTTAGTTTVTVKATDSSNPTLSTTGQETITINPLPPLTLTGTLPNATLGVFYTQTLQAAGGLPPYTYAIAAGSGALPPGITLSSTGVISGTPTSVGASSFTVVATDSEPTPQTASLPLVLLVVYPTTANDSKLKGPYAFLFQGYDDAVLGVLSYQTATIGSFTADGTGVVTTGELDANHQYSAPKGATVPTQAFLGTYTIGADNRGSLTITTLNTDRTVNYTTTYAISVHAPISPATTSASGDLIEYDNDQLAGTRGSGTFLQQTVAAMTAGLTGNYVFGTQGDTPCLLACTVNILGGPVVSVGQLITDGAGHVTGESDANIASTNLATLGLTGSYAAPDADGRVQLSMATSGTLAGTYPQDYAVYLVDGTHAFMMSTDKHSQYILLAGSAEAQTSTIYTAASLSGPYIGYENAPTNPGLVGTTLQNVLNLSTATVFRGTGGTAGTCTTTNVDQAGLTGLVNGLTGLGSGAPILNALLGTYASTGNSNCIVAANGRTVLNYPVPNDVLSVVLGLLGLSGNPPPPRVAYLASQNQGYFLETGYAGLGNIEKQIGAPFSLATLNGTFVYGTSPAASVASINASGIFNANGAGTAYTTLDENIGVGTINVLELGQTANYTYTLTDATAGRFQLGSSIFVYAITPTRYVLIDENALTTSPSVALIY